MLPDRCIICTHQKVVHDISYCLGCENLSKFENMVIKNIKHKYVVMSVNEYEQYKKKVYDWNK
jgi:hypothetical protein